jgi:hypothetical protein
MQLFTDFIMQTKNVERLLDDLEAKYHHQKTLLSALKNLTLDNEIMQQFLKMKIAIIFKKISCVIAKKSPRQLMVDAHISDELIKTKIKMLEEHVLKNCNCRKSRQLLVLITVITELDEPRRNLDFTKLKWNVDDNEHNYVDFENNEFVFNRFKNSNKKSTQRIQFNSTIRKVLLEWKLYQTSPFVFTTIHNKPLSSSMFCKFLKLVFKVPITNGLRRHRLKKKMETEQLNNSTLLTKVGNISAFMNKMGSSIMAAPYYVKSEDDVETMELEKLD